MQKIENIVKTPWDSKVFGLDTFEINLVSENLLDLAVTVPGHYTVRVGPLDSKKILHDYGFYYCDTLIEPYCSVDNFIHHQHEGASLSKDIDMDKAIDIVKEAFIFDRFHRDFNIQKGLSDLRYESWLREMHSSNALFGLMFHDNLAGFLGYTNNKIELHAMGNNFRGKGLAKYLLSAACKELFSEGYKEISSSISAANTAAHNLYCSLGFKFRNPKDIYHKLVT